MKTSILFLLALSLAACSGEWSPHDTSGQRPILDPYIFVKPVIGTGTGT